VKLSSNLTGQTLTHTQTLPLDGMSANLAPSPMREGVWGEGETEMISGLTRLAKALRKNATEAENILWNRLRSRQMEGTKFRRQQPIESYIVDFVSFEKRIIIELDGGQHAEEHEKDRIRDGILEENRFRILRFWNNEIFENLDGVLETIRLECLK